ncbi:KGG domain-containing protein [Humisphaera borealis]|uniref:Stress-induced protein n=1 Tax=Humisphaera borealis TaxID=2807512 RepID=A0A7M2WSQ2_9BACT|nr:KGG domain-containing protein [Humisphaera borealis]QOV88449.1 stress-induced protein [Humisphaera borealis]
METTQQTDSSGRVEPARGFASMADDRQREIARKGGRAAHAKGTAHEFTTDEARAAGQKGGQRVSANREHMSRIGRIGGKKSAGRRQEMRDQNKIGDASDRRPGQTEASDETTRQPGDAESSETQR